MTHFLAVAGTHALTGLTVGAVLLAAAWFGMARVERLRPPRRVRRQAVRRQGRPWSGTRQGALHRGPLARRSMRSTGGYWVPTTNRESPNRRSTNGGGQR